MSTVIIESGLDVPNANTLVVDAANLLGLSQMYQLRGRVGRSHERAFAYFFFPQARADGGGARAAHDDRAAPGARQRVQIALRDLEIRGAGNVLGAGSTATSRRWDSTRTRGCSKSRSRR